MPDTATEQLPVVRIVDGASRAELSVPASSAPELVTDEALLSLARERGILVTRQVDASIRAVAAEAAARAPAADGEASPPLEAVIAVATPPQPGCDARIEWCDAFRPAVGEAATEPASADATDHYNRIQRLKVRANDALGKLVAPTDGVDGVDVCGRPLAARRGRKLAMQPDDSVQVEADGTIRALKEGVLSLARLRIAVVDSLEVAGAVDFSTGNIDFVGSVAVAGGVRDNFTLRATGDVVVRDLVESADLVAGGDCRCERGIAGRGSGCVLVDGSLEAAHLNAIRGRVRGNLTVDREIMGCDLVVGGDLRVARGAIVGGNIVVGGRLKASAIGTEAGAKTAVRVGGRPLELVRAARIAAAMRELAKRIKPLEERQEEITERGDKATAAEKESLTELAFEIAEVERHIKVLEERRLGLLVEAGVGRTVHIEVDRAIHAGTTLLVGNREAKFVDSLKGPVTILWDESRNLQFRAAGCPVRDLRDVANIREVAA